MGKTCRSEHNPHTLGSANVWNTNRNLFRDPTSSLLLLGLEPLFVQRHDRHSYRPYQHHGHDCYNSYHHLAMLSTVDVSVRLPSSQFFLTPLPTRIFAHAILLNSCSIRSASSSHGCL